VLINLEDEDVLWIRDVLVQMVKGVPLTPPNKDGVLDRLNVAINKSITKELEQRVIDDHAKVCNRVILLPIGTSGTGYLKDSCECDDTGDFTLDTPAIVRVSETDEDNSSLLRWQDDHIDPYWDIWVLESHPQLDKYRSVWIDGRSYCADPNGEHGKPIGYELVADIIEATEQSV
jgi:hypothetical protein